MKKRKGEGKLRGGRAVGKDEGTAGRRKGGGLPWKGNGILWKVRREARGVFSRSKDLADMFCLMIICHRHIDIFFTRVYNRSSQPRPTQLRGEVTHDTTKGSQRLLAIPPPFAHRHYSLR